MLTEKEKNKLKRKKEREKKKEELKYLKKMFQYDENGKKRTTAQINKKILENLGTPLKKEEIQCEEVGEKSSSKFRYRVVKETIYEDGREIKRTIETDC